MKMRGRLFAAALILAIVIGGAWEGRRRFYAPPSPATPLVPAPVASDATPIPVTVAAPKLMPPQIPKKTVVPKNPPAPIHAAPRTPVPPASPYPVRPVRPPVPPPPPPQEWKGNSDTSIKHSGEIVVQTDTQWNHFWAEHHPEEVSPDVDFSRNMVVGVFLGERPADGFSVQITGARTLTDAVVVDYIERAPPPGTFQVSVEAYPYDIKVIPRSTLHVKFNKLTAQYLPDTSILRSSVTSSSGTKP